MLVLATGRASRQKAGRKEWSVVVEGKGTVAAAGALLRATLPTLLETFPGDATSTWVTVSGLGWM